MKTTKLSIAINSVIELMKTNRIIIKPINPKIVFFDYGGITQKHLERLKGQCSKAFEIETICLTEVGEAFRNAGASASEFSKACRAMTKRTVSFELKEDKPIKKSYNSFINNPIGKQRRK